MEEDGIGMVLARASELRSKFFSNCIDKATTQSPQQQDSEDSVGDDRDLNLDATDEDAETLLNIHDALQSLESQLSSLQAMQQQQRYEREAALAQIDYSRKLLLEKLKSYKGEDLEVIREASAFASETVEHNTDLLLPPYPSCPPHSLVSHFPSSRKFIRNGFITSEPTKTLGDSERNRAQPGSRKAWNLLGFIMNGAAKTVITLLGVISVLSLAGFEPKLRRRNTQFGILGQFQESRAENGLQCPPGKVLVVEDGETRCVVKERIEIPFESVVATPDVNYGCG